VFSFLRVSSLGILSCFQSFGKGSLGLGLLFEPDSLQFGFPLFGEFLETSELLLFRLDSALALTELTNALREELVNFLHLTLIVLTRVQLGGRVGSHQAEHVELIAVLCGHRVDFPLELKPLDCLVERLENLAFLLSRVRLCRCGKQ